MDHWKRVFALVLLLVGVTQHAWAEDPATFFRGINLNGPALVIDGQKWESGDTPNLRSDANAFENQQVPLIPATDAERAKMLRSSRWGRGTINVDLTNLPAGLYQICLYVWEDNDSSTFSILINNRKVLDNFASGAGGSWKRLGPWSAKPVDGVIRISARGGDANLSGVEIWSGNGTVPNPLVPKFNSNPTSEQLAFFESKIRPLLIDRCYSCHSESSGQIGGGLLLDSHAGLLKGGDTEPPIIPGNPDASLMIKAVRQLDPDLKMPPEGKLSVQEIEALEQWIRSGSPDPRSEDTVAKLRRRTTIDWDRARDFWSLKPLNRPAIPAVADEKWPTSNIDRFVLAKLETAEIHPTSDASRQTLLRRVTYDLTGLPPTPEEQVAYEVDDSPNAYTKVIDRLLDSPRYGERWGRHWLDVVRYSDTAGDNSDYPVPQMYLYRNWVIDAFNRDLPYDQFVRDQLAGDLIGGETTAEKQQRTIATGYLANARRFGSRVDDYPWHLTIEDTLDNLGRTFLATTLNCARCHNHKFDPITADDYYGLYGILQSTRYPWPGIEMEQKQRDLVPLIAEDEARRILEAHRHKQKELDAVVGALEKNRDAAKGDERKSLEQKVKEAREVAERHSKEVMPFAQAYAVKDADTVGDAALQTKGDPSKPGAIVPRHFLTMLNGAELPDDDKSSGRLQLANWIVDPNNPLTARVMVNRIWLYHFGRGLVASPNDFGRQGKSPTHPELLDYLATEFIGSGWSIKALHRQILLSRTYRMSSRRDESVVNRDPSNELLGGFSRRRLDAEALRDTLLQLSGRLDLSSSGPHPFPPQTEWKFTQHNPFKAVYDNNHRSVYLMVQRIQRHPYLAIFDGADPAISTPQRLNTTTPMQALYLMNNPFVFEVAAGLAQRLISSQKEVPQRIELAYRLIFCRSVDSEEVSTAVQYLADAREQLTANSVPADQLDFETWQSLVRSWLRLNEFVYLD